MRIPFVCSKTISSSSSLLLGGGYILRDTSRTCCGIDEGWKKKLFFLSNNRWEMFEFQPASIDFSLFFFSRLLFLICSKYQTHTGNATRSISWRALTPPPLFLRCTRSYVNILICIRNFIFWGGFQNSPSQWNKIWSKWMKFLKFEWQSMMTLVESAIQTWRTFLFFTENKFGNNKNVGIFKGWKFYRSKTTTRGVSASSPE